MHLGMSGVYFPVSAGVFCEGCLQGRSYAEQPSLIEVFPFAVCPLHLLPEVPTAAFYFCILGLASVCWEGMSGGGREDDG